jgi:RNA-directed DNA polymerase
MVMEKEELLKLPVSTRQQRIAEIAQRKRGEPLTLLHHYIDETWLRSAYFRLRKESAPGIDGQTVLEYGKNLGSNVRSLLKRAKTGTYKAPAVRGTRIPKPGKKKEFRPLGIPTTEDKVLQKAVLMVLEPIYELEFYGFSYGFRKGKSQHQALDYLWHEIMYKKVQWIIDLDIRKFFDTVKHEILRQLLHKRVRDGVVTRLIGKWLKAGVLEDGSIRYSDEGTPQGGIISPMLSNIYLHEALDKWFVEVAQPRLRGRSLIVRFADDVILGFENKTEAEKVLTALNRRFERYGLKLHPEKTRLLYFGKPGKSNDSGNGSENDKDSNKGGNAKGSGRRSFDFLGFTHYWGKSLKGKWVVKRKTASKKLREKLKKMNEWCKEYRHYPIEYQYEKLCQKLKGHYAYYGITGNMRGMQQYLDKVKRIWKKWLCRRSWKTKLNWEKFNIFLTQRCPLPPVKVVHSIYAKRAAKQ